MRLGRQGPFAALFPYHESFASEDNGISLPLACSEKKFGTNDFLRIRRRSEKSILSGEGGLALSLLAPYWCGAFFGIHE